MSSDTAVTTPVESPVSTVLPGLSVDPVPSSPYEAPRPCAALTTKGKKARPAGSVCGNPLTSWVEGEGWRCRHHRAKPSKPVPAIPGPEAPPAPGKAAPADGPPVSVLETPQDVARLTGWAALQAARGQLSQTLASSIATLCREWRQSRVTIVNEEALQVAVDYVSAARDFFTAAEAVQEFQLVMSNRRVRRLYGKLDAITPRWLRVLSEVAGRASIVYPQEESTP